MYFKSVTRLATHVFLRWMWFWFWNGNNSQLTIRHRRILLWCYFVTSPRGWNLINELNKKKSVIFLFTILMFDLFIARAFFFLLHKHHQPNGIIVYSLFIYGLFLYFLCGSARKHAKENKFACYETETSTNRYNVIFIKQSPPPQKKTWYLHHLPNISNKQRTSPKASYCDKTHLNMES